MDSFDMFGTRVYSYNFEGRESVHSVMGVMCSCIVRLFALYFFYEKGSAAYYGTNPIVTFFEKLDVHTNEAGTVDLKDEGFELAFAVRDYLSGNFTEDPNQVMWEANCWRRE